MSTTPRVITPAPDDEVAAALLALLARTHPAEQQPLRPTVWNSPHRTLRVPLSRGRDAWRLSFRTP